MDAAAVTALIIAGVIILVLLILTFAGHVIVIIRGQDVGILERRYFGRQLPRGRVVAMGAEIGFQARTLRPGLLLLIPFLYSVRKVPMTAVNEDEVGLVECIDGQPLE